VTLGVAGLLLCGHRVRHDHVTNWEVVAFHWVNRLPDRLERPAWIVMQMGNVAAAPVAAAVAVSSGRRQLGGRLLAGGIVTWVMAKAVKRVYRRPRPNRLVSATRIRGEEAVGHGYVSGHAGIVAALASAAWPEMGAGGRVVTATAVPLVAATRIYVGAHLPLDVLGGAALGLAVQGVVDEVVRGHGSGQSRVSRLRSPRPRGAGPGRRSIDRL
jgi:undecaprenyl-diphosphatase